MFTRTSRPAHTHKHTHTQKDVPRHKSAEHTTKCCQTQMDTVTFKRTCRLSDKLTYINTVMSVSVLKRVCVCVSFGRCLDFPPGSSRVHAVLLFLRLFSEFQRREECQRWFKATKGTSGQSDGVGRRWRGDKLENKHKTTDKQVNKSMGFVEKKTDGKLWLWNLPDT